MNALFGKTTELLSLLLEYRSERHKTIASNIVNIDTPGYRSQEVVFEKELAEQIAAQRSRDGISGMSAAEEKPFGVAEAGEHVDIDKEMAKLAENHLMYNLSADLLARKFRGLKDVIKGVK